MSPSKNLKKGFIDSPYRSLYWLGGAAAVFNILLIPIQLVVFINWPPPETTKEWFSLFQQQPLVALLSFEFLFVVSAVIGITTMLSLYYILRENNPPLMALALVFSLLGALAMTIARPAIEMLYLSGQYAAALNETQQVQFLAAGEVMLALYKGTTFHVSYNLANINLVIVPLVMLRSRSFNKVTAYMGLLAGILGFGIYLPKIGLTLSILSVMPFYLLWNAMIARRLFQLARGKMEE